jgi:hypothetical protein
MSIKSTHTKSTFADKSTSDLLKDDIRLFLQNELQEVRNNIHNEFAGALHDIQYQLRQLHEKSTGSDRVHTSDLNIASHMIEGYTTTNNSPSAGYVAWAGVNIVYKGTTYALTDGNSNNTYLYWTLGTTPTVLRTSNTKPVLTIDDVIIGINNGGTFTPTLQGGKLLNGVMIADATVSSNELGANSVIASKIASGAVGATQIAAGAVGSTALGSGAVTSGAVAAGAIGATALASGAVGNAALAANAVQSSNIAAGAVGSTQIATNGVSSSNIASGAVGSTQLAANAVTSTAIASGAVGATQLAANAVGSAAISSGAIGETKLNIATHFVF